MVCNSYVFLIPFYFVVYDSKLILLLLSCLFCFISWVCLCVFNVEMYSNKLDALPLNFLQNLFLSLFFFLDSDDDGNGDRMVFCLSIPFECFLCSYFSHIFFSSLFLNFVCSQLLLLLLLFLIVVVFCDLNYIRLLTVSSTQFFFYSLLRCFRQIGGLNVFLYADQRFLQCIEWAWVQHLLLNL